MQVIHAGGVAQVRLYSRMRGLTLKPLVIGLARDNHAYSNALTTP